MSPPARDPSVGAPVSDVKVVVDPAELRTVASRYTDAAGTLGAISGRVGCRPLPEMPPEIVGRVTSELQSVSTTIAHAAAPFPAAAKELTIRAMWADISAAGGTVSGLSARELRDFVTFMKDGSMLDYATDQQKRFAGQIIGDMYRGNYKEPEKLLELAAIMKSNGEDPYFAGAFIDTFGAKQFADIPRVIQAMEWGDALLQDGMPPDNGIDRDLALEFMLDDYHYDGDAADLLASFSTALASATYAGTLSRDTQRDIAYDEDKWGVAQLLTKGTFGAEFLRDVFHSGVIEQIGMEGGNANWGGHMSPGYFPIGGHGDHQLPIDQKQIILDALERNPEAIALSLSSPVPERFQFGVLQGEDDPLKILYDHMPPDDDWEKQFARMYTTGVDWANDNHHFDQAYGMTESLVDRTLHSDWQKDGMTEALANDLAAHHMENIHLSASAAMTPGAGNLDIDGVDKYRLIFDQRDLTDLMREFADHDEMNTTFLGAARDYQAHLILDHTQQLDGKYAWTSQVGGFDSLLMNANDLDRLEDFDASNSRHKMVFSFVNSVTGAVQSLHPAGAAAGIVTGPLISWADDATAPSISEVVDANQGARNALVNQMHAAIAAGYYENGHFDSPASAPPSSIVENGHLIDIRHIGSGPEAEAKMRQLIAWLNDEDVNKVAGEAWDRADQARDNQDLDLQ
jgi:hypothetical protein